MGKHDDLRPHCAIVTGAAGGIGFQFCRTLAARKCALIMSDMDMPQLEAAARRLKSEYPDVSLHLHEADLTSENLVDDFESFCTARNLQPDILINNAGIFAFSPVAEMPANKLECFIKLHARAVTLLSQWFAKRRLPFGEGYILNMSSMSCWMPMPGLSMYAATKAYIRVFSRSLHYELRDAGIGVTVACPGGIATDLFGLPDHLKRLAVNLKILDTPERFARNAVNRMLRKRQQYINGWLNRLSIVAVGSTPTSLRMIVKRQLLDKKSIRR